LIAPVFIYKINYYFISFAHFRQTVGPFADRILRPGAGRIISKRPTIAYQSQLEPPQDQTVLVYSHQKNIKRSLQLAEMGYTSICW
jgi:hypothetical protein